MLPSVREKNKTEKKRLCKIKRDDIYRQRRKGNDILYFAENIY